MAQNKMRFDQKALADSALIVLLRETLDEIEARGESNELNLLLRDFARELLIRRLFARVEFVQLMELRRDPGSRLREVFTK